jgi:hypothetical protein
MRERFDEQRQLLGRHAAVEGDALDPHLADAPQQLRKGLAGVDERDFADDDFVLDEAHREAGIIDEHLVGRLGERFQGAAGERM